MTQSSPFPSRAAAATCALEDATCRPLLSVNHPHLELGAQKPRHSSLGALDFLGPLGRPVLATSAAAASQPGSWSSAVLKDFLQPRGYLCHPGVWLPDTPRSPSSAANALLPNVINGHCRPEVRAGPIYKSGLVMIAGTSPLETSQRRIYEHFIQTIKREISTLIFLN